MILRKETVSILLIALCFAYITCSEVGDVKMKGDPMRRVHFSDKEDVIYALSSEEDSNEDIIIVKEDVIMKKFDWHKNIRSFFLVITALALTLLCMYAWAHFSPIDELKSKGKELFTCLQNVFDWIWAKCSVFPQWISGNGLLQSSNTFLPQNGSAEEL